jgi:2-polyprenyl-3-methyl-5-hydroxy-6-metoxy-1,4-benzoquinol methylase
VVTIYDNQFYHDNVYGHALALLETVCKPDDSVHLDVGCGFGRIAEPLVGALGRTYVGIDADRDGLSSLSARGFETHQFMLQDADTNLAFFRKVLEGRRLGSITIIDTLEHLFDPRSTIAALRTLAAETAAPIVVSVPNIAHLDVAAKLMMGRFDYTEDGLLDHTHVRFFTEDGLLRMMAGRCVLSQQRPAFPRRERRSG